MRRGEMLVSLPFMNMVRHSHPAMMAALQESQSPEVAERSLERGAWAD